MRSVPIDQGTIDRAIDGDKEAYATLVQARGSRSLIFAERILRSPEDAVTAARKLFVLAYINLKKLKDLGTVELWLMQNLVRLCGESLKEATKKGVAPPQCDFPKDLAVAGLLDSVGAVDAALIAGTAVPRADNAARAAAASLVATRRETVRKATDCLPFLERTAVIFRDWDGMSYLEVAEILRVKQDEMRKILVRGRKGVAEMLMPRVGNEPRMGSEPRATRDRMTPGNADARTATQASVQGVAVDKKTARELARRHAECGKVHDKIWLLTGGEVGPMELEEVRTHLAQCPECTELLKTASIVLEAIRDAAPLEDNPLIAPEMLWKEVEPLLVK